LAASLKVGTTMDNSRFDDIAGLEEALNSPDGNRAATYRNGHSPATAARAASAVADSSGAMPSSP